MLLEMSHSCKKVANPPDLTGELKHGMKCKGAMTARKDEVVSCEQVSTSAVVQ